MNISDCMDKRRDPPAAREHPDSLVRRRDQRRTNGAVWSDQSASLLLDDKVSASIHSRSSKVLRVRGPAKSAHPMVLSEMCVERTSQLPGLSLKDIDRPDTEALGEGAFQETSEVSVGVRSSS